MRCSNECGRTTETMKLKRLEGESQYDWNIRKVDENLRQSDRNLDRTFWLMKFGLFPIIALNIIVVIYKLCTL